MSLKAMTSIAIAGIMSLGTAAAVSAQSPEEAIAARKQQMQTFSATMNGLRDGQLTDKVAAAQVFVDGFAALPDKFPEGSHVGETRALPKIWEEWDNVTAIIEKGRAASQELHTVAQGGDDAAFQTALGNLGAVCGECHSNYRAE